MAETQIAERNEVAELREGLQILAAAGADQVHAVPDGLMVYAASGRVTPSEAQRQRLIQLGWKEEDGHWTAVV